MLGIQFNNYLALELGLQTNFYENYSYKYYYYSSSTTISSDTVYISATGLDGKIGLALQKPFIDGKLAPYVAGGIMVSTLDFDEVKSSFETASESYWGFGSYGKAGIKINISQLIIHLGLEYNYKTFDSGDKVNSLAVETGVGINF